MPLRFTVLASGSAGNASLLEADGFGVLIDIGLGPRLLASRLAAVGASWSRVHAVLLTHTHSDHWNERTLAYLQRLRVPLYCHPNHHGPLSAYGTAFAGLCTHQLVREYQPHQELVLHRAVRCLPLPLPHDGGATFGFRFEGPGDFYGEPRALGYVADLGSWTAELAGALADVDLLALEFNHDVDLEYASGRSARLIARVLGDHGHLSNAQAVTLLEEVLRLSSPGRLRQLVQLHLSRDCNRPELAAEATRHVTGEPHGLEVHTARQHAPGPSLVVGGGGQSGRAPRRGRRRPPAARSAAIPVSQPWLPGVEG